MMIEVGKVRSFATIMPLLLAVAVQGQKEMYVMTGFVLNQDREPVVGAQVRLENYPADGDDSLLSTVTDESGHYMITVDGTANSRIAVVSAEGYPEYRFWEQKLNFSQGSQAQSYYVSQAAVFYAGQLATIILPTTPDASFGQYYRLDRVEDKHLMFERELTPKANVPYLIIPHKDFRIEYAGMEATDKWVEQRFPDVSFYGFYTPDVYLRYDNEGTYLIDKTPDCYYLHESIHHPYEYGARIGAMRALITLKTNGNWANVDGNSHTLNDDWRNILVFHDSTNDSTFTYKDTEASAPTPQHAGFAGVVTNQNKEPVAHAHVRLKDVDGSLVHEAETDANGHFLLPIVDSGKPYEVTIAADGYPEQIQYRDGWLPFDFSLGSLTGTFSFSNKAVFKTGQRASIILPFTPDPSLGKFYRLEMIENGKIIFCKEPKTKPNVPYLIIPNNDFDIEYPSTTLPEQAGEISLSGVSLKGFYNKYAYKQTENEYTILLDTTSDCCYVYESEYSRNGAGCTVGPLRAVLVLDEKEFKADYSKIIHHDKWTVDQLIELRETTSVINDTHNDSNETTKSLYDLQGRRVTNQPRRGVYIRDGKKVVVKSYSE